MVDIFAEIHKAIAMRRIPNSLEVRTRRSDNVITGKPARSTSSDMKETGA